eukprot:631619_1
MVCYTGSNSEFGGTIDCGVRVRKAEVGQSCDLICENDPTKVKKLNCYAEAPNDSQFYGRWKGPNCHPVSTDSTFTVAIIVFGAIVVIWFLMVLLVARATKARQRQRHYQKHNIAPPVTVATAPMGPLPMEPMWPAPPEFAAPMGPTAPEFATPMRDYTLIVAIVFGAIAVICFLMVLLRRWRHKLARATRVALQRQRHYQKHNTVHVVQCAAPPVTVATAPMGPTPMAPMRPAAPEFAAPMGPTAPEFATPMRATAPEFATSMRAAAPEFEPPPYMKSC